MRPINEMMKIILSKKFSQKKKLNISINWLSYKGHINFNQTGQPENISVFKNELNENKFTEKTNDFSSQILFLINKFQNIPDSDSKRIREQEFENLLSQILEKNRLKNQNNKIQLETTSKKDELYENLLISSLKEHLHNCN